MKLAICNDLFKGWKAESIFRFAADIGFDGIEIAPFMYADNVKVIGAEARQGIVDLAAAYGLEIVGLHWVLVGPEGVYLTHPERGVRKVTRDYLLNLIEFCGDIGGKIIVFGSPRQRNLLPGVSREEALEYAGEVFRDCLEQAADRGVVICIEPLGRTETDFITSISEAFELVERVAHPNFQTMVDIKAALTEERPVADIIQAAAAHLYHVHLNDQDGLAPGSGPTDFRPIIRELQAVGYNRYLSVEVFKLITGVKETAREAFQYLQVLLTEDS